MSFSHIWKIILETNTLNFIVFFGLILLIFKKIKLSQKISDLQKNIENEVQKSNSQKKSSEEFLEKAKFEIEHVNNDIEKIIDNAKETADKMAENIIEKGQNQIKIIEKNAQNAIENDVKKVQRELSAITASSAVKLTENAVIRKLEENPNLQQVFIDEAINKLESMEI